jgi:uncharacterized membrane protein YfcA
MIAVNVLIVLGLCAVVGAFTGLVLGGLFDPVYLAIIAGFLATVVAIAARNIKIPQLVVLYSALAIESRISPQVTICAIIASLIGSLAAVQVATMIGTTLSPVLGALAGLFSGILMAMIVMLSERSPTRGKAA